MRNEIPAMRGGRPFRPIYVLVLLTIIYMFNSADRTLFGLYVPLIKQDLALSDTMVGIISGFAFTLFYAVVGLPIAWAADRWSRKRIISVGFLVWSLATVASGFIQTGFQLALTRFALGAGEASNVPAGNSMIADLFSSRMRPFALAIFASSAPLAMLICFPVLGAIGQEWGWRAGFVSAGIAGAIVALFFYLTVSEPERVGRDNSSSDAVIPLVASVRRLLGSTQYVLVLCTFVAISMNVATTSAWYPAYLTRSQGLSVAEVGSFVGPLRGIMGLVGTPLGGWLTAYLARKNPVWQYYLPAFMMLLIVPSQVIFLLSSGDMYWKLGLAGESFFGFAILGPVYALLLVDVPPRMYAVATSIGLLVSYIFGQSIGPLLVGVISDVITPNFGPDALRYALFVVVLSSFFSSLFCFLAGRYARKYIFD